MCVTVSVVCCMCLWGKLLLFSTTWYPWPSPPTWGVQGTVDRVCLLSSVVVVVNVCHVEDPGMSKEIKTQKQKKAKDVLGDSDKCEQCNEFLVPPEARRSMRYFHDTLHWGVLIFFTDNISCSFFPQDEDRQKAANNLGRVQQAFQLIGASEEEVKAIFCVLAAVYHLGVAGATKGQCMWQSSMQFCVDVLL